MMDKKKTGRRWLMHITLPILTLLLFRTILFIGYVPTQSMEPTLEAGSYILGTRLVGDLKTGEIIVFQHYGQLLVKRIAACPGDRIDRRELTYMSSSPIPVWDDPILIIPKNCYFVLGDNTQNSIDSRYWEDPFVHSSEIVARIFISRGSSIKLCIPYMKNQE